ncbi:MAG: sensor histidine kinase [Catenulispora sp.]|nr:sensor histidine kinase [Catenulispora sp.]
MEEVPQVVGGVTAPRLARQWRAGLVVASLGASAPVLVLSASAVTHAVGAVLIALQAVAVWWLVDRLLVSTVVVLVVSAALQLLFPSYGPGIAFVVLCTYAWLRPAAEKLWMFALAVPAVCGPAAVRGRWDLAGLWLGAVLLAWSWGALMRARGQRRAAEQRQAVLEERARIARDLHDVLSHTVSVMVVQAAAADDVFESNPQQARVALRRTEEAGRQALAELRGFLRTVRADSEMGSEAGSGAASEADSLAPDAGPQPMLADVPRLTETMSQAGLAVTLLREGDGEVPPGVQVGAYRIVQEALTNTLRHARASAAEVLLRVDESHVRVRVRDDGRGGAPARGGGHGLVGMRERATLLGGTLYAGPRWDAPGFEVEARLPTREGS